jgi:hypothetical protein
MSAKTKKCEFCGEKILFEAIKCKHCKEFLNKSAVPKKRKTVGINVANQEKGDATGGIIPYKNPPALISYYFGVFSLIPFLGILLGIAAVILGIIGLKRKNKNPIIKGTVHAWIGIICGWCFAFIWISLVIIMVASSMAKQSY